jgi:hypothetical protein
MEIKLVVDFVIQFNVKQITWDGNELSCFIDEDNEEILASPIMKQCWVEIEKNLVGCKPFSLESQ